MPSLFSRKKRKWTNWKINAFGVTVPSKSQPRLLQALVGTRPKTDLNLRRQGKAIIQDLPDEILLQVFALLPADQLVATVAKVCRQWHRVHSDPVLYTNCTFTTDRPSLEDAITILSMAPRLKRLVISGRDDTESILQHVGATCGATCLETLVLHDCRNAPSDHVMFAVRLKSLFTRCGGTLRRLSLDGTFYLGRMVYTGLQLPQLRQLDVGWINCSPTFTNFLNGCRGLEEIQADFCQQMTDSMYTSVLGRFAETLRVIKIDCLVCTNITMTNLARCRNLEVIHLTAANRLTNRGLLAIADLPRLRTLEVHRANHITPAGWATFFSQPAVANLSRLWIHYCLEIDDNVLGIIAEKLRSLRMLQVEGGMFTRDGVETVKGDLVSTCSYRFKNGFEMRHVA